MATVNKDLRNKELGMKIGALDPYTKTKKVQTPLVVYILECFMLALLTGMLSPLFTWTILWDSSKKL